MRRLEKPPSAVPIALLAILLTSCAGHRARGVPDRSIEPPLRPAENADSRSKFDADLEGKLERASDREHFRVLVDLTDQVDLVPLVRSLRQSGRDKASRQNAVIGALERVATRQQAALGPALDAMVSDGTVDYWVGVAIVNRIVLEGSAPAILRIAGRSEVARILPDWSSDETPARQEHEHRHGEPLHDLGDRFVSWAVGAMGVDEAWRRGYDGRGVVVAVIDTGVLGDHEQLRGRALEGSRGWFDPVTGSTRPFDNHGHGTGVLACAVGGNPDGRVVGVAPGARWAAALGNWQNRYSRARMTLAADWVLRVARPDVLVNAWSDDKGICNRFDVPFIDAWKAAGIFVVFPAGNSGPRPGSGEAPAELTGVFPGESAVFSVGGLAEGPEVMGPSSRGPSRCGSAEFPSLAAPGADLPYALPPDPAGYGVASGTSFSAGLIGGAAAILLQAAPDLDPDELATLLTETCRDLPPPGRDDDTGAGIVDLRAALDRLEATRRTSESTARPRPAGSRRADGMAR